MMFVWIYYTRNNIHILVYLNEKVITTENPKKIAYEKLSLLKNMSLYTKEILKLRNDSKKTIKKISQK